MCKPQFWHIASFQLVPPESSDHTIHKFPQKINTHTGYLLHSNIMYDATFTSIFVAYGSSIPLPGEPLCRSWTHCIAIAVTGVDLQGSLGSGLELRGSRVVRKKLRVRMIQNGEAMVHTCFYMFLPKAIKIVLVFTLVIFGPYPPVRICEVQMHELVSTTCVLDMCCIYMYIHVDRHVYVILYLYLYLVIVIGVITSSVSLL